MSAEWRRIPAVAGALALAACAAAGARAQTTTPAQTNSTAAMPSYDTDANVQVYQDAKSEACDKANNSSPEMDGLNPLGCFKLPVDPQTEKCTLVGQSTLVRQTGNICYYCQDSLAQMPQAPIQLVLPEDDVTPLPVLNGFACFEDEGDQCYIGCIGTSPYTPPPGTTLLSGKPPLQGSASQTADPCFPAGPKNYNVCSYPNLPRPAGCTCSETPAPKPETATETPPPSTVMAQQIPNSNAKSSNTDCLTLKTNATQFTPADGATVKKALLAAQSLVTRAKAFTDQEVWNADTQAASTKWFGNANPSTQTLMRTNVNNVYNLLNGITSANIYPKGADALLPVTLNFNPNWAAYVHVFKVPVLNLYWPAPTKIFLTDLFFEMPALGQVSQEVLLVHEASHLPDGAQTQDVTYGPGACQILAYSSTIRASSKLNLPKGDPLINADSFAYFVYAVASQPGPSPAKNANQK